MSNEKDIVFYSELCNHCKELLQTILKNNLRDSFQFVNVDKTNPASLPEFVDRVPIMFLRSNNKVIMEEQIDAYILTMQNHKTISPFMTNDSHTLCFLEDTNDSNKNSKEASGMGSMGFSYYKNEQTIQTPPDDDASKETFDQLLNQKRRELGV